MAQRTSSQRSTAVSFKSIELFKDETLGIGSYGKVCRAKCDHLPCAAKTIHETLFDPVAEQQMPRGHEYRLPIRRFEQECEFLNRINHPNIVQYLGLHQDPDTGLPVLLMELMDDSLTNFLEAATQQIPYHIQVNICHDITMALTFLHASGIVHRDLSSNNVLLISNVRAKVTDFGMAKLSDKSPQASHLTFTLCPGTNVYMPPEATQDHPVYTEKIDCFSFGVLVIQVLTRQFPKPGDRMQRVETNHPGLPRGTLMLCIPEVDRRRNHISKVDPSHSLLPIACECLKDEDVERPSAPELCERVAALKGHSTYIESARVTHARETDFQEQIDFLQERVRELKQKDDTRQHEIQELIRSHNDAIATKDWEIQQLKEQISALTKEPPELSINNEPRKKLMATFIPQKGAKRLTHVASTDLPDGPTHFLTTQPQRVTSDGASSAILEKSSRISNPLVEYYRLQSCQTLGNEQDRTQVPIWISPICSEWLQLTTNAMAEINTAAPGIYMYVTPKKGSSLVQITGGKGNEGYTEGDILTSKTCKVHLGNSVDKRSMKRTIMCQLLCSVGLHPQNEQKLRRPLSRQIFGILRLDPFSIMKYERDEHTDKWEHDPLKNTEMSELDKLCLNLLFRPCKGSHYDPKLSSCTALVYCGRRVMDHHNYPAQSRTNGRCGPDNGGNCPACRTIKNPNLNKILETARWQGWSGEFYCGRCIHGDKYCGPDNGTPCRSCFTFMT